MEIVAVNPDHAFFLGTAALLRHKRVFGLTMRYQTGNDASPLIRETFNKTFKGKTETHFGLHLPWSDYLSWTNFPQNYYEASGKSLKKMLAMPELSGKTTYRGLSATNSFYGMMARKREGLSRSFAEYAIDRFKDKLMRAMPHFYFDVESPAWVWQELVNNVKQVKTGRSACTCVMNFAYRWDNINDRPMLFVVVKHCNWSHFYGDIYGSNNHLRAFMGEIGYKNNGEVVLFFVSITMDAPAQAKKIMEVV